MCILVASREHPDFALVVLDNRDEYMDRPTAPAHWWPNEDIYGPQDLARSEKGTWLGITRSGRLAVLLNVHESSQNKIAGPVSRGILPKMFLESHLMPKEWKKIIEGNSDFANCGGFTLMVGVVNCVSGSIEIEFVSNRDTRFEPLKPQDTISVSNGAIDDPSWKKTSTAMMLLRPLLQERDQERFVAGAVDLLSTETPPPPTETVQLRNHIFVPHTQLENKPYGTRTQTILTIDHQGRVECTSIDTLLQQKHTESFSISIE